MSETETFVSAAPEFLELFGEECGIERVAIGFKGLGGIAFSRIGYLLFSDSFTEVIFKYRLGRAPVEAAEAEQLRSEGPLTIFRQNSSGTRGLSFDRQGRLLACEASAHRLTRTEKDGSITVLAGQLQGSLLNGPADVVHAIDGSTYFTDPKSENRLSTKDSVGPTSGVHQICRTGETRLMTPGVGLPRGLALSPRQDILFVSDARDNRIWSFPFNPDGSLLEGSLFAEIPSPLPGALGGLKTDESGRLYCAGPGGIWVFDDSGKHLGNILLPEAPSNLGWGDEEHDALYITAETSLYRVSMKTTGTQTY